MQVEIVGHDGGPQNAQGDVDEVRLGEGLQIGQEIGRHLRPLGVGEQEFNAKANADCRHQTQDDRLQLTKPLSLQTKNQDGVEPGQGNAPHKRNVQKQFERQGGPQDLGHVTGDNGDFSQDPKRPRHGGRIAISAELGEIASGHQTQAQAQDLQDDRRQTGGDHHAQQRVAELRAAPGCRWPSCPGPCSRRRSKGRARGSAQPFSTMTSRKTPARCLALRLDKKARWPSSATLAKG